MTRDEFASIVEKVETEELEGLAGLIEQLRAEGADQTKAMYELMAYALGASSRSAGKIMERSGVLRFDS